jgi:hypothetical protein
LLSTATGFDSSHGPNRPYPIAADGAGNIYFDVYSDTKLMQLPRVFVDVAPRVENGLAGTDSLPPLVPATVPFTQYSNPTSDQPWLTITGTANDVVSYAFTANTGTSNRTAHITLLDVSVAVTQRVIITPPVLTNIQLPGGGGLQFSFTNTPGATFTVWASTNLSLPFSAWTGLGPAVETPPGSGQFQFTDPGATNSPQGFYRVSSP